MHFLQQIVPVLAGTLSTASAFVASNYNNPTKGPPSSLFQATSTIDIAALKTAAAAASETQSGVQSTYPLDEGSSQDATIHSDWQKYGAFVWIADMDVDCDGIDYKCQGNQDGQPQTNFGALAAYEVPWIVIPDTYSTANSDILTGNNVAAVICGGKMFYGIFGDSDGDDPQVIGEASWLMARTCFPNDNLNGGNGHTGKDVVYILFTGDSAVLPSSAVDENYVNDFNTLRNMGDSLVSELLEQLQGSTGTGNCDGSACAGDSCTSDDDCAGSLVCANKVCSSCGGDSGVTC